MKVWISKYALTQGVLEFEVRDCGDGVVTVEHQGYPDSYYHKEGRDWHRTREGAIAKAEEMRKRKIASLKNQIKNIEKMVF